MEALIFFIILMCGTPTYFFWRKYEHEKFIKEFHIEQSDYYRIQRDTWKFYSELLEAENEGKL